MARGSHAAAGDSPHGNAARRLHGVHRRLGCARVRRRLQLVGCAHHRRRARADRCGGRGDIERQTPEVGDHHPQGRGAHQRRNHPGPLRPGSAIGRRAHFDRGARFRHVPLLVSDRRPGRPGGRLDGERLASPHRQSDELQRFHVHGSLRSLPGLREHRAVPGHEGIRRGRRRRRGLLPGPIGARTPSSPSIGSTACRYGLSSPTS